MTNLMRDHILNINIRPSTINRPIFVFVVFAYTLNVYRYYSHWLSVYHIGSWQKISKKTHRSPQHTFRILQILRSHKYMYVIYDRREADPPLVFQQNILPCIDFTEICRRYSMQKTFPPTAEQP